LNRLIATGLCVLIGSILSCTDPQKVKNEDYLRWVGDIPFNQNIDDPEFELCYEEPYTRQYFNFAKGVQYNGGKPAIIKHFKNNYKSVASQQSGLLRIRFIVNCKGETGRFRLMGANEDLKPMQFDTEISRQLLNLTREMTGWLPIESEREDNAALDYYQYLIFKIHQGKIIEIMP